MGKTTILYRLAYEVERTPTLNQLWIPICFDEEQYNVGGLADFWLNCFEVLAEQTADTALYKVAERVVGGFPEEELEDAAFRQLSDFALRKDKGLLLLVDNFDVVLGRIEREVEKARLRERLQHERWLMLVGAASKPIEATYDYDSPFYELFHVVELQPLDRGETAKLLTGLGELHGSGQEMSLHVSKGPAVTRQRMFLSWNGHGC